MDVASFQIDHDRLLPGVYVSRKDYIGQEVITTFDVRMKRPTIEPPVEVSAIHTLEHLMAVYIRSKASGWAERMIYVGPMGCRTGMYIVMKDDLTVEDILPLLRDTFKYVADFTGIIPATTSKECGNYLDHNIHIAKYEALKYLELLLNIKQENMLYPE